MSDHADFDQQIVQEMIGRFDAPSFMRRAKLVETTWQQLVDRGARERRQRLQMVRLRLGQVHALAGSWDALGAWLPDANERAELQRLYAECQPRLLLPLAPTASQRELGRAVGELIEAMQMFNARWEHWLAQLDLTGANAAREAYNRYYLLEKECALGSARVARTGFQALPPITRDDVALHLPLLKVPRLDR